MFLGMGAIRDLATAAAGLLVQSEAQEPIQQTEWQLDAPFAVPLAADRCMAIETFRKGHQTLRLILEARPASDHYAVLIETSGRLGGKPWVEGTFRLDDKKPARDIVLVEASSRPNAIVYQLKSNRAELKALGAASRLTIRTRPKSFELTLDVPQIDSALSQLDACASEFLESWGFSLEAQRQISTYPQPERNLYTYASSADYPSSAITAGAMGEAHVLVWVGDDRRASNCQLIRSSGHADIDTATCNIVTRRVRFIPGRNLNGSLASSPAYLTMRWELPR